MGEKKMDKDRLLEVLVIWRNTQMKVEINSNSNVKELGTKLVKLSNVKPDTMKLLVPLPTKKGSKIVIPFSEEYCSLTLQEAAIPEGKSIRMMGVFEDEIVEVSQNSKSDLRIIGFEDEEKRLQQRTSVGPWPSLKLPQGAYTFSSFRTLHIPGIELNPAPSEALRRMHMLACDPGIIAIMNKHHWQVGVMTEMAPEGYVGISPKCLLGFNKNHGEEISLRLRTDDLKGFRKYESIKKTLLHELAHMVHSEHDANFFALNRQLNQEAESLDWTKLRSHTLSGRKTYHYEPEHDVLTSRRSIGKKLGGASSLPSSARVSSVAAAYSRNLALATSTSTMQETKFVTESKTKEDVLLLEVSKSSIAEPDPDDKIIKLETGQDNSLEGKINYIERESYGAEPDPDDVMLTMEDDMQVDFPICTAENCNFASLQNEALEMHDHVEPSSETTSFSKEPDPDESLVLSCKKHDSRDSVLEMMGQFHATAVELDPDGVGSMKNEIQADHLSLVKLRDEPDPDDVCPAEATSSASQTRESLTSEPELNDHLDSLENQELLRIGESVDVVCKRLQKAIESLRFEIAPAEATSSLQTLFKIIKNLIEHPDNVKFRRLRKGNHSFQRNVANYKAAMEFLFVVGFCEDVVLDEVGRSETYVVLKRNDPGLLWLAKSTLEFVA